MKLKFLDKTQEYYWQQAKLAYYRSKILIKSDRVELNPNLSWDYWKLGDILLKQEKWQQAFRVLSRSIKLNPSHRHSYTLLTKAYEQLNNLEEEVEIEEMVEFYANLTQKIVTAVSPHFEWYSSNESNNKQPNFIIIGQGKCGTSFLYDYLCQHPQIIPALKKEIDFWSRNYELGLEWYRAHFAAINPEQNFITGEASPSYFGDRGRPKCIAQIFPQIKLIVLLRNPVERTISDYYMSRRLAREKRNLSEAVFNKTKLSFKNRGSYLKSSHYINLLRHWLEVFPKEQFLILKSEDMFANPEAVIDKAFEFLEVEPYQLNKYKKINSASYPDISFSERKLLQDYFRPYNQELEAYLDREFNWYD